jgi:hypothetical protein
MGWKDNQVSRSGEAPAFPSEIYKIFAGIEVLAVQSVFNRKQANTHSLICG